MNRYAENGLVRDMESGKLILAVFWSYAAAVEAMKRIAIISTDATLYSALGQEKITHASGGTIYFRGQGRSPFNGMQVDIVYSTFRLRPEEVTQANAAVFARNGEIIEA